MLQVQDLDFQYGEETLFSDVDFVVYPGLDTPQNRRQKIASPLHIESQDLVPAA